ncbi:MAG: arylesterase [Bryobacteraceae bacterium]|nr:arylesterase [Bryobacteraceae bacterium]
MYRFLLFSAAALLVACGNRPEAAPAESAAPPAQALNPGGDAAAAAGRNDGRPALVAFGDSLTAGYGVDAGLSYPDFLQKKLDREGIRWRVVNAGISGETTAGGLNRIESILKLKPDLVVLELGGNDGLRGLPLDQTRSNLEAIITRLRGAGIQVVLAGMTLPPNYGPQYIRQFENIYKDLARKYKLPLIPFFLEGVATVDGKYMQSDGIHATAEGNQKVAETVFRYAKPLLN